MSDEDACLNSEIKKAVQNGTFLRAGSFWRGGRSEGNQVLAKGMRGVGIVRLGLEESLLALRIVDPPSQTFDHRHFML